MYFCHIFFAKKHSRTKLLLFNNNFLLEKKTAQKLLCPALLCTGQVKIRTCSALLCTPNFLCRCRPQLPTKPLLGRGDSHRRKTDNESEVFWIAPSQLDRNRALVSVSVSKPSVAMRITCIICCSLCEFVYCLFGQK